MVKKIRGDQKAWKYRTGCSVFRIKPFIEFDIKLKNPEDIKSVVHLLEIKSKMVKSRRLQTVIINI